MPPTSRSPVRAWVALLGLSVRRQGRVRAMVFVALGLLAIAVVMVAVRTYETGWSAARSRYTYPAPKASGFSNLMPPRPKAKDDRPPRVSVTYGEVGEQLAVIGGLAPFAPAEQALFAAASAGYQGALAASGISRFTRAMLFSLFLGFLLPVWCLAFATEALGGELESRSLVWLLTRPIPRWSIYLAKYLSILPWALSFTIGGFWLMSETAGQPGRISFRLCWPAIALGTLAFTSLFHLFSAVTRRPTVVGLVYCFFLETLLGDMPGLMKRISISYYVRCMIFDAAAGVGLTPDKPSVYQPVSGSIAMTVLIGITVFALAAGMIWFGRSQYNTETH
jgi:ABC-type transport system involved in multi-copper enzyme maturation permease subunit